MYELPTIVIIGRPNVGKSTLFNRLTRSKQSLVIDQEGVTRDRIFGEGRVGDKDYLLIDTGGLGHHSDGSLVDKALTEQARLAAGEASLVLFVVDMKQQLGADDTEIARYLRKLNKPVILVVNKAENQDQSYLNNDFHKLGFEHHLISASHNRGISSLADNFIEKLENAGYYKSEFNTEDDALENAESTFDENIEPELEISAPKEKIINLAIVGKPNVGKSTLVNRMLGEERVVVLDMPGTTTDSISIDFKKNDINYKLIDTAGLRKKANVNEVLEKFSAVKTLSSIKTANVVLMLIDGNEGIGSQDLSIMDFVLTSGRALVIAINKWDGLSEEKKQEVKEGIKRRFSFVDFAKVHFISALHGSGVGKLWDSINEAYNCAIKDLSTSLLSKILEAAVSLHAPPLVNGRRIKLRYAHCGGHNPPRIVIHGNQTQHLSASYQRFIVNFFRESLGLVGTPIKLEFVTGDNPYKDKRNTLSSRQIKKKKRLRNFYKKKDKKK